MKPFSFRQLFGERPHRKAARTRRQTTGRVLRVEHLEDRTLLASPYPFVVSVTPEEGTRTPDARPIISVTYSEGMVTGPTNSKAVDNPANYRLFDSSGTLVTIDSIAWDVTTFTATISYNGGNLLPIDAYTLFVRGDQIYDLDAPTANPLSGPGQLVVANSAIGNLSIVNTNYSSGELGALSNVPVVSGNGTTNPTQVELANLSGNTAPNIYTVTPTAGTASFTLTFANSSVIIPYSATTTTSGDIQTALEGLAVIGPNHVSVLGKVGGPYTVTVDPDFTDTLRGTKAAVVPKPILDLVIVNDSADDPIAGTQGTSSILIFQGRQGGGFDPLPTQTLNVLRSTSGPGAIAGVTGIAFGDVNNDGALDLAISSQYRDTATVYLNGNKKGTISFPPTGTDYVVDKSGQPGGVTFADMDADGNLDLLISNRNTMPRGAANNQVNEYNITVWKGVGDGSFQSKAQGQGPSQHIELEIGSPNAGRFINPWGVLMNTQTSGAMVAADVNQSGTPDIIVAGANGIGVLINGDAGTIQFSYEKYPAQPWPTFQPDPFLTSPPFDILYPADQGPGTRDGKSELLGGFTYVDVVLGNFNNTFATSGKPLLSIAALRDTGVVDIYLNRNAGPAATPYTFAPTASFAVSATGKLGVGDFNGDGFDDIVVTSNQVRPPGQTIGSGLQVLINKALATGVDFVLSTPAAPTGQYEVAGQPLGVTVGDTNQDGVLDVVTAGQSLQSATNSKLFLNAVSLLLGDSAADGTPTGKLIVPVDIGNLGNVTPGPTATGDLNDDGVPDLAQILRARQVNQPDQVAVFLAKSPGVYSNAPTFYSLGVSKGPIGISVGDMDGDGAIDIVVANQTSSDFTVLWNDSKAPGAFGPTSSFAVGQAPTGLTLADFDLDGLLDVAVSHNSPLVLASQRGVGVSLNLGLRVFETPTEVSPGVFASSLVATDFNRDGIQDLLVTDNKSLGQVIVLYGNGSGNFPFSRAFNTVDQPTAIALGDFNRDGFEDVVVVSGSASPSHGQIGVMLSSFGTGLNHNIATDIVPGVIFKSAVVTSITNDAFPDVVLTVSDEVDGQGSRRYSADNLYTLLGNGDGSFGITSFYQVGGPSGVPPPSQDPGVPNVVGVINDPFEKLTTFETGGTITNNNLLRNGNFEKADLTGEKGNLDGWTSYNLTDTHGAWKTTKTQLSPISLTNVNKPPRGLYAAMADQANLTLPWDTAIGRADYSGTRLLYQDVFIPENATSLTFSLRLFLDTFARWTDPGLNPSLDYRTPADNQQFRIDLVVPPADSPDSARYPNQILDVVPFNSSITDPNDPRYGSVLKNLYLTTPATSTNTPYLPFSADLTADLALLRGKTVRLRIAAVNNINQLIVGVDNVQFRATYNDAKAFGPGGETPAIQPAPVVSALKLRNPGVGVTTSFAGNTTDPTMVGYALDDSLSSLVGSPNNLYSISFDTNANGGFNDLGDITTNDWDAVGNFAITLDTLAPGTNTVGVQLRDKAGNLFTTGLTFNYLAGSKSIWSALGPAAISTADLGVRYPDMSGKVTDIAVDPRDASGNTFFVASANGGIWRTTNGGQSWTPLTDHVVDQAGQAVNVSAGGMALDPLNPDIIYVATGIGDNAPDSRTGIGVLKSTDGGRTWAVIGNSPAVLGGARITKIAVGADIQQGQGANFVYVAVASGGAQGPGVYRSSDGGITWTNVLTLGPNGTMTDDQGNPFPANAPLPSVTDLLIDPFDSKHITIGLGYMLDTRLTPAGEVWPQAPAAGLPQVTGVFVSGTRGNQWQLVVGGKDPLIAPNVNTGLPSNTIPTGWVVIDAVGGRTQPGPLLGRITLGQGRGRVGDERNLYVLIANPPDPRAVNPASPGLLNGQRYTGDFQSSTVPSVNNPTLDLPAGLYKSKDYGLNWTRVRLRENILGPATEGYRDINLLGAEASDVGAVIVDPNNPAIVYVGGSRRYYNNLNADPANPLWPGFNSRLLRGFIRVDTTFMRDTTYTRDAYSTGRLPAGSPVVHDTRATAVPFGGTGGGGVDPNGKGYLVPNDGDDIQFYDIAFDNSQNKAQGAVNCFCFDDKVAYHPVGVAWVDLEANNVFRDAAPAASDPKLSYIPTGIQTLAFDSQGRLLVGTERGIWRGVDSGFSPQVNARLTLTGQPMTFTSLNFNLQISSLTSVAVDPSAPETLYTSETGTGTARTESGLFGWQTMGVTGPIDPILNDRFNPDPQARSLRSTDSNHDLKVPDAAAIRVGVAVPGQPTQVYRSWAFQNPRALVTEYSIFGGDMGSFDQSPAIAQPGNGQGSLNAPQLPPMAISPVQVFNNNQFFDQLIFGTDRVFRTNTGARAWTDIVGRPLSSIGGLVTAVAFAGSDSNGIYAGTDKGEVYVTLNNGQDAWPLRTNGLPAVRVNGLTSNPNNPLQAWAMVGGGKGIGHVYQTTDGGLNWKNISSNLPDSPANTLVFDPRNGRLFVGTDVGVYASSNGGSSWSRLGAGLPNAPVIDLQFSAVTETLAAGTGRGVFTISSDLVGPNVASTSPNTPVNPPLAQSVSAAPFNAITVNFNETLDASTMRVSNDELTRSTVVASALVRKPAYYKALVREFYVEFMMRQPTARELNAGVAARRSGKTNETVISTLVGSDEYFTARAANDFTTWVNTIYQDLLGRAPSANELATAQTMYLQQLGKSPSKARTAVAFNIVLTSDEYRTILITNYYNRLLQRPPSTNEIAEGLGSFATRGTDETILVDILGSLEYYRKNHSSQFVNASYTPPPTGFPMLTSGAKPVGVAVADMNGDGFDDIISANNGSDSVTVFYSGSFYNLTLGTPTSGTFTLSFAGKTTKPIDFNATATDIEASLGALTTVGGGNVEVSGGVGGPFTIVFAPGVLGVLTGTFTRLKPTQAVAAISHQPLAPTVLALPVDAEPKALALADFTGDGRLDIAVANSGPDNVSVFLNQGGGAFLQATGSPFAVGNGPNALVVADFDGDGFRDIAVGDGGPNALNQFEVNILPGLAGGTFGAAVNFNGTAGGINGLAQADLGGVNARPELVLAGINGLVVFENASTPGSFAFNAQTPLSTLSANSVALGTIDTGTSVDIAASFNFPGGVVQVYQNMGGLVFAPTPNGPFYSGGRPFSVTIRDLNADGQNDVAVVNDQAVGSVTTLLNNTVTQADVGGPFSIRFAPAVDVTGTLTADFSNLSNPGNARIGLVPGQPVYQVNLGAQTSGVFTLTFNGATTPPLPLNATDSAIQTALAALITVGAGNVTAAGPITFARPYSINIGGNPKSLALADLDHDLALDVITANSSTDDIWMLFGQSDGSFRGPTDASYINDVYLDVLGAVPTTKELNSTLKALLAKAQISIIGPHGSTSPLSVDIADRSNPKAWQITFAPQTFDGTYNVRFSTKVTDVAGNGMQGQNRTAVFAVNSSANGRVITGMTHDLLSQAANTNLFLQLLGTIEASSNKQLGIFAKKYVSSAEYRSVRVAAYEAKYSASASQKAIDAFMKNGRDDQLIANILSSSTVDKIYQDLLERQPTAKEAAAAARLSGTALALKLLRSPEGRTVTIKNVYGQFLGRFPQASELPALLRTVPRLENFLVNLLKGAEYYQRAGGTNVDWLNYMFSPSQLNITGFDVDDGILTLGTQTAGTFTLTFNGKTTTTIPFGADANTIQTALAALSTIGTGNVTVTGAVGGPFTISLSQTLPGGLTGNFRRLSARKEASVTMGEHRALLNSYLGAREKAANTLLLSTDYLTNLINGWYDQFLKREPTTGELNNWIGQLRGGALYRSVIASLVGSQEYFIRVGVTTNDQWLAQVFPDLLGRAKGPFEGITEFLNPLNAGLISRTDVALRLLTTYQQSLAVTPEYRTKLIQTYYATLLGRQANASEVQFWLSQPNSGPNDRIMLASLLGSNEYFVRPHPFP